MSVDVCKFHKQSSQTIQSCIMGETDLALLYDAFCVCARNSMNLILLLCEWSQYGCHVAESP